MSISLKDVRPATIDVNVFMIYALNRNPETGKIEQSGRQLPPITLQLLTKYQWEDIGFTVADPIPDKKPDGTPDYSTMRYRTGIQRAEFERDCRRLAYALTLGGVYKFLNEDPDDLEERARELREMDAGVFNALYDQLRASANVFQRTVDAQANSFRIEHRNGRVQTPDVSNP